jgi:hypothetical protein
MDPFVLLLFTILAIVYLFDDDDGGTPEGAAGRIGVEFRKG